MRVIVQVAQKLDALTGPGAVPHRPRSRAAAPPTPRPADPSTHNRLRRPAAPRPSCSNSRAATSRIVGRLGNAAQHAALSPAWASACLTRPPCPRRRCPHHPHRGGLEIAPSCCGSVTGPPQLPTPWPVCSASCSPTAGHSGAPTPTSPGCSPAAEQVNPCGHKPSASIAPVRGRRPSRPHRCPPPARAADPAPVIASMLGFHDTHTAWLVAEAGGTWSRYVPGDDHNGEDPLTRTRHSGQSITRVHQHHRPGRPRVGRPRTGVMLATAPPAQALNGVDSTATGDAGDSGRGFDDAGGSGDGCGLYRRAGQWLASQHQSTGHGGDQQATMHNFHHHDGILHTKRRPLRGVAIWSRAAKVRSGIPTTRMVAT